jgi:GNAT superfamily N-acetyltransferase
MLRRAQPSDESAVVRIHVDSWRSAYRGILSDEFLNDGLVADRRALWHERFANLNRADQLILVSGDGTEIRGFACVLFDADGECGSLLDNLHVAPGLKGKGLGRELMAAAAGQVEQRAIRPALHLWVYEKNAAARGFYERMGGQLSTSIVEPTADGNEVKVLRYVWQDLSILTRAGGEGSLGGR